MTRERPGDMTIEEFSADLDLDDFLVVLERLEAEGSLPFPAESLGALRAALDPGAGASQGVVPLDRSTTGSTMAAWCEVRLEDADTVEVRIVGSPAVTQRFERATAAVMSEREAGAAAASAYEPGSRAERERLWSEGVERNRRDALPVIAELEALGVRGASGAPLDRLGSCDVKDPTVLRVLLRWLPRMENIDLKVAIGMQLSLVTGNREVRLALFDAYHSLPNEPGPREVLASVIQRKTGDAEFDLVAAGARDVGDSGRWAFIMGLGKMRRHRAEAIPILLDALEDPDLAYIAIESLADLRAVEALPRIRPLADNPDSWKRNTAKRAIAQLERRAQT